jgi:hypothetical protein
LRPGLADAEQVLAPWFGVSPQEARLAMQTLVQLVARYALCSGEELCLITGEASVDDAERAIGDHLVDLAAGLLLVPRHRRPVATAAGTSP